MSEEMQELKMYISFNQTTSYTSRKVGSDGCIQVFIGCGHPIQTWARTTE
jgi:hypothetical protein